MFMFKSIRGWQARTGTSVLTAAAMAVLSVVAATPASADAPDFRVGIQLADGGGTAGLGVQQFTGYARFGNTVTTWAGDNNNKDPDGARIELNTSGFLLTGLDFRIGGQARDKGSQMGTIVYTPWASEGGGFSDLITDSNSWDPDQYRIFLDVRPMPAGEVIADFRLWIQAFDHDSYGAPVATPWASQGGGRSAFALDSNAFDPDGFAVGLEVA